jgi:hypothetical protein
MEEMKNITVSFGLKSMSPMKMDKWIEGTQPKNDEGYRKQAQEKCYKNDKGMIVIPAGAVKAAMKLASSEIGKKMEAKKNRQTIQSAVFIEDDLSTGKKEPDEIVKDIVTRKGQGDKVTRVPTYRPLIKEWKAQGVMHLFGVPEIFVKECLELAGFRFGLLSHRPEFGRFVVSDWKIVK